MTTLRELKQYVEDLGAGLALRLDDLSARLDVVDTNVAIIRVLLGDRSAVDPQVVVLHTGLTPAQSHVAVMLADGNTVRDIALKMGVKENTVRTHIKRIRRRLGVSTQAQVVRIVLMLPRGRAGA